MNRLKNWISKYGIVIIVFLFVLFILKGCQSSHRKNTIEFIKIENQMTIDSLNKVIDSLDGENSLLSDSIHCLTVKLEGENERVKILADYNDKTHRLNEELVKNQKRK